MSDPLPQPDDAFNAIEAAAYQVLSTGIVGATVTQHASEDLQLPLVIIGDMEGGQKIGGKGRSLTRGVPVSIIVLTEGEERKPCSALIGRVEALLDDTSVQVGRFSVTFYLERSASVLAEEGHGYVGLVQFNVFAIAD